LEIIRDKKPIHHIYKAIKKNGDSFWVESIVNPIVDPVTNQIKEVITVVRDYSECKKFEEELSENSRQKDFLLREIHNRVKNNFAILSSLMNMLRNEGSKTELDGAVKNMQLRIKTMALVHEHLFQSNDINYIPFDNYLQHLCTIISSSYSKKHIKIITELNQCILPIDLTLPLGLIVNELLTNAYKYAFPDNRDGYIKVTLFPVENEKFCISVSDNGIGLPETFTIEDPISMGTKIVEILVRQIEGTMTISNANGACFQLIFSATLPH
jgi:two-component sensor histidine kinase